MGLSGRTAIVTGAGIGIGKAIAIRLAEDGANIVVADIRNYEETAREIETRTGAKALGLLVDVSNETEVNQMTSRTLAHFGSIDVLVNNAGLFSTLQRRPFDQIPISEWQRVIEVNVFGAALCCKSVVSQMRKQQRGRIINMASAAPLKGAPLLLHYVASKGALIAMTRGLARELGRDGITVNAIAPGFTLSDGVLENSHHVEASLNVSRNARAIARDQIPEDIVGAVSFLAGDDSSFVTGQTLAIDGGAVML